MDQANDNATKDVWDKLSALSGFIAAVLVPIVVALVGNWYSAALKDRETTLSEDTFKREWVQIGLSILRDANTTNNMREWTIAIINFYSKEVKIPRAAEKDLTTNGAVLPPAAQMSAQAVPTNTSGVPLVTSTERVAVMNRLQTQGIKSLIDRDFHGALEAYNRAYESWPTFRNVEEIRAYLGKLSAPESDQQWKELYRTMRKYDLRGVDAEVMAKLQTNAQ